MREFIEKNSLSDFTRSEFLNFVERIFRDEAPTEAESNMWVQHFEDLVAPNPQKSGLIFWPEVGVEVSPEGVVGEVERYCRENGLPGFRQN